MSKSQNATVIAGAAHAGRQDAKGERYTFASCEKLVSPEHLASAPVPQEPDSIEVRRDLQRTAALREKSHRGEI